MYWERKFGLKLSRGAKQSHMFDHLMTKSVSFDAFSESFLAENKELNCNDRLIMTSLQLSPSHDDAFHRSDLLNYLSVCHF